ncbi:hypothetical protein F0L17_16270 [Streptomyces sp. TRM43335]|uniref:Uncharacterized protein n=1 Tax=Streptomyces taklimakanensis TaxID=2569853 RepID=A0A6G2BEC6_9ACTN|nr:hypothetical protein [Streptomyces taklimakanensis]MTE20635.1 hypothetical protein [Streptomyces taklimakanensis]
MDPLHEMLREEADAYRPDRARLRARVWEGVSAGTRGRPVPHAAPAQSARLPRLLGTSRASWPRIALGALAATAALLAGVLAVTSPTDGGGGSREVATAPLPTPPDPDAPAPSRAPSSPDPSSPDPSSPSNAGPRPGGHRVEDGPLWAEGSIDPHSNPHWAQGNITLGTREPLTSLVVEVRIARTDGVRSTGDWRTLPEADFTATTREEGDALVYRWTLKEGRTVPAGEHVFAVQYDRATAARDTGNDTYAATATTADGEHTVRGGFRPPAG